MSNFSFKWRLVLGVATALIVAIFLTARSVASWRPQLIGVQSLTHQPPALFTPPPSIDAKFLTLSSDGQWLRVEYPGSKQRIWNTTTRTSRACDLWGLQFSKDSRTLLGFRIKPLVHGPVVGESFSIVLQTPEGRELWATPPKRLYREIFSHVEFTDDSAQAITNRRTYSFDLKTGNTRRVISRPFKARWGNMWRYAEDVNSPDGSKTYSSSETSDSLKRPTRQYQVDVLNAHNSKKLWSYPTTSSATNGLACYPQWEDGGKSLATIESNTLFLRDAQTGKILISHRGNLPAPLKSWAFTQNHDAVYLMDAKGQIFRKRLR